MRSSNWLVNVQEQVPIPRLCFPLEALGHLQDLAKNWGCCVVYNSRHEADQTARRTASVCRGRVPHFDRPQTQTRTAATLGSLQLCMLLSDVLRLNTIVRRRLMFLLPRFVKLWIFCSWCSPSFNRTSRGPTPRLGFGLAAFAFWVAMFMKVVSLFIIAAICQRFLVRRSSQPTQLATPSERSARHGRHVGLLGVALLDERTRNDSTHASRTGHAAGAHFSSPVRPLPFSPVLRVS